MRLTDNSNSVTLFIFSRMIRKALSPMVHCFSIGDVSKWVEVVNRKSYIGEMETVKDSQLGQWLHNFLQIFVLKRTLRFLSV